MRWMLAMLLLGSCGRLGFDAAGDGTDGASDGSDGASDGSDGSDGSDDSPIDAPASCIDGDGMCPPGCVGTDDDCAAGCGDGVCSGGELCTTCGDDCDTQANVCGNGACSATETSASCYADCGPSPWPWMQDETDLLAAMNTARTEGRACNGGSVTTAPALTFDPGMHAAAREWVWERAHQDPSGFARCNGRTTSEIMDAVGANGLNLSSGATTTATRLANWLANPSACASVMNPAYSFVAISVAVDADDAFIALFR